LISQWLPWVEIATVAMIALVVGFAFRSIGAPLAVLASAAVAYVVATRLVAWAGTHFQVAIPPDLEPVLVVLLLGVATDYSVFFLSGMRDRLADGSARLDAAKRTVTDVAPIIFAAGSIVTAGTAALLAARSDLIRAFGPTLAITVFVTMAVSISLIPALIAIFGRVLYWPHRPEPSFEQKRLARLRSWLARVRTAKPVALVISVVAVVALSVAGWEVLHIRMGLPLVRALPNSTEAARAETAAAKGFAPGILSPTAVILQAQGIGTQTDALARLEQELRQQPDVAGVLGPADTVVGTALNVLVSESQDAVRYVLVLNSDPLAGPAVDALNGLRDRMSALLDRAGLSGITVSYAGNTAIVTDTIRSTISDLWRVGIATLAVDLLLLMLFLRSLVAPFYLMVASLLALAASLGLTTYFFQSFLGSGGITYFVPFVAAVLLVSLGADYNVFLVGRIWEEAGRRPLREAIITATPRASRAINLAGLTLALSFGFLALVPLDQFREVAFAMGVGILLDAFVVRPVLVPALISLFGYLSGWPGKALRRGRELEEASS
jgi:RND superfamily putative drug exporter